MKRHLLLAAMLGAALSVPALSFADDNAAPAAATDKPAAAATDNQDKVKVTVDDTGEKKCHMVKFFPTGSYMPKTECVSDTDVNAPASTVTKQNTSTLGKRATVGAN